MAVCFTDKRFRDIIFSEEQTMPMRRIILAALAIAATFGVAESAAAKNYPSRPIALIVPFSAGGPTDTIARIVGERMAQIARSIRGC
jgi:tripartite-type tricarboxylate transporter receptor subunit TctC